MASSSRLSWHPRRMLALLPGGRLLALPAIILLLSACSTPQPTQMENLCQIFKERPSWYKHASASERRWKSPMGVMMAILAQESSFKPRARPPRTKLLWVIPWTRPSSSFGYTQALTSTWKEYKAEAGRLLARRSNFRDSIDFVGWYNRRSARLSRISAYDPYSLYLAYHEGHGGYNRRSYARKDWLKQAARNVARRAERYEQQLAGCRASLDKPWWRPW